jgi:signal transduction histidine kinase
MNDLLARPSRGNATEGALPATVAVHSILSAVADTKNRVHPVLVRGDASLAAVADSGRLEQALIHLVQNAIDSSPPDAPVRITLSPRGSEVAITIEDKGAGMSAQFVRTRLFQPFASTKEGGFGIGAFEARTLVSGMGGRLEVDSQEGEGSCFTILLPAADTASIERNRSDRRHYDDLLGQGRKSA